MVEIIVIRVGGDGMHMRFLISRKVDKNTFRSHEPNGPFSNVMIRIAS